MRKLLKRFVAAASAVVIGGVSCVTTWFSVPVAAAGGFGWLEWGEFESLLQGVGFSSGGGGYKNVQEATLDWLNMTSDQFYKLTDPTDGGTAKPIWEQSWWGDMTDWLDHVFGGDDGYSKVADVGADVSGGGFVPGALSSDGKIYRLSVSSGYTVPLQLWSGNIRFADGSSDDHTSSVTLISYDLGSSDGYMVCKNDVIYFISLYNTVPKYSFRLDGRYNAALSSGNGYYNFRVGDVRYQYSPYDYSVYYNGIPTIRYMLEQAGISLVDIGDNSLQSVFSGIDNLDFRDLGVSDDFIGPVYTYPAAQELYKSTGTAAGIRLDVQTQDGVPDIQAALDGAGVDTVDALVAGVAAGTVPMSKVFSDAKVTPYVVADTATGAVVTDLGVSATATGVKAVGLTQELAVPKDLTNAAAYTIKGKTWDPEMSKYKLPLFQYFPFCLPWDIYQVLAAFSADPVAPVFDVPVGKILSGVRSADVSKAASMSAKIDFGDDNWSKVFEIIRILECAGIIVGLCLVAVYLIHGGR